MSRKKLVFLALALALGLGLFTRARVAVAADQVVTDCGDTGGPNQLRAKIDAAQSSGGGTITFTCASTIILNGTPLPDISTSLTLNGGNKITISGNNASRILNVNPRAQLTLQNIVLTNGLVSGDGSPAFDGGAIYNNGSLILVHTTIQNSQTGTANRGGAIVSYGELDIIKSTLANNKAGNGGAIYARYGGATVNISSSALHDNQTTNSTNGFGGAILLWDGATVSITGSTLSHNNAHMGGVIHNAFANSSITLQYSTLNNNTATGDGGAILNGAGTATLTDDILSGNHADVSGGGIFNDSSTLILTRVTLAGNSADAGGGILNYRATATLTNVTLSGNSAVRGGGFDNYYFGIATLANVTFANNTATTAGGIHNEEEHHPQLYLTNVLLVNGTSGANCRFDTQPASSNLNLSSDNSCSFGAGRDGMNVMLGPLANNGGLTPTHLPALNPLSPAIDNGTPNGAPATDQRGIPRPQGAAFDVGAVEVCQTKPAHPTLLKPKNGNQVKGPDVTLAWSDVPCIQTYSVLIRLGSPTDSKVQKAGKLTAPTFKTKALVTGQTYYWQVTVTADAGKAKSDWWSFTVK